jgi:hypothetical protein
MKDSNDKLSIVNRNQGDLRAEGNAMMNYYQTRIHLIDRNTCWGKFKYNLNRYYNFIVPLKGDIKFIYARYDRSVSGLFETLHYLMMLSLTLLLVGLYLLVIHISYTDLSEGMCGSIIPCALMFSRFNANDKLALSVTIWLIIIFLFISLIRKWSYFKKKDVMQSLFDNDETLYSKVFFDSWDWKVNSKSKMDDQRHKIHNAFIIGITEKEIKYIFIIKRNDKKAN